MKEIIHLTKKEYENLKLKRKELKLEVKEEYNEEVRIPAIWGAIGLIISTMFLYPYILEGYNTFPKLTTITSFVLLLFYLATTGMGYGVLKKRLSNG